jgi:hypothetical protein
VTQPLWTQALAIKLCNDLEPICAANKCHVALTGGLLYKEGPRKDADIMIYRVRQAPDINREKLLELFKPIGVTVKATHGWVWKCDYLGYPLDLFWVDHEDGDYPP